MRVSSRGWALAGMALLGSAGVQPLAAQVTVAPPSIEPAAFERIALRVANPDSSPVTRVRLEIPDVITVMGLDAPPGWLARHVLPTDTSAAAIVWSGDSLRQGAFREFALLVRLDADVRDVTLVFPVRLDHADGRVVTWTRGGDGRPPTMSIRATTGLSPLGVVALAGGALGVAVLALALALSRRGG